MKAGETWQTEQHEDSVGEPEHDISLGHLRVLTGEQPPPTHTVQIAGISIGRVGGDCEVRIANDARISRKHVRIERSIAGWQIQDLYSRNGFYLNGKGFGPGERVPLPDSGVIRLGDTLMVFRASPQPVDERIDSTVFPGISPAAAAVRRRIDALSAASGHVLILGETGTGKESVAKAIGDARAPHPLVTLNCAQLNRELARAELFGHVRGAFTHAVNNRPGLVDLAGDGALFLDEIGELPFDVQAELLRFLEDGSYRAVGATELRHSHARVVAATNVDLDRAVLDRQFRRDLLARLRATNAPLQLPPLRERREDLLGWTQLFFREIGRDPGARPWTAGALECLLLFPWEENLRQLLGVVRHAAGQTAEFPCSPQHLPKELRDHRNRLRAPVGAPHDEPTPQQPTPPDPPPRQFDPTRDEIIEALRQTGGRVRTAAQSLGVDRRKLYRLCERFGIALEDYRPELNREDE
jgi:transcriptional regulator with GAF, ATPase, and Fis domain